MGEGAGGSSEECAAVVVVVVVGRARVEGTERLCACGARA
jgi:hypothetical protein